MIAPLSQAQTRSSFGAGDFGRVLELAPGGHRSALVALNLDACVGRSNLEGYRGYFRVGRDLECHQGFDCRIIRPPAMTGCISSPLVPRQLRHFLSLVRGTPLAVNFPPDQPLSRAGHGALVKEPRAGKGGRRVSATPLNRPTIPEGRGRTRAGRYLPRGGTAAPSAPGTALLGACPGASLVPLP